MRRLVRRTEASPGGRHHGAAFTTISDVRAVLPLERFATLLARRVDEYATERSTRLVKLRVGWSLSAVARATPHLRVDDSRTQLTFIRNNNAIDH